MDIKKLILPVVLVLFVSVAAFAQDRNELKGPKHKNYKPWKNTPTEKVIVTSNRTAQKGPEAKNYKPWNDTDLSDKKIVSTKVDGERVKGPKAKNAKPWNN